MTIDQIPFVVEKVMFKGLVRVIVTKSMLK